MASVLPLPGGTGFILPFLAIQVITLYILASVSTVMGSFSIFRQVGSAKAVIRISKLGCTGEVRFIGIRRCKFCLLEHPYL